MSAAQTLALAIHKERLFTRIEMQRDQIALCGAQLEKPFAAADKAVMAARFVKERPWIAAVAALSVVVLGRRNLLRWASRGWVIWRGWRVARQWLQHNGYLKPL